MNSRERFRRLMRYEPVDRLPVLALEPYEPTAIERWRGEGLPAGADPVEYLGMSRLVLLPLSFHPSPGFDQSIVAEDETYVVQRSPMGALKRHRKDNPTLFYGHIDHPVKTRADWEAYKQRFRASSPGRCPADWLESAVPRLNASEDPVGLCLYPFFFRLGFYAMGMERFLSAFYEEPDLLHDIFAYWSDFVIEVVRPVLGSVKLDFAMFTEDLAGKNGPLISPRIYEEFWHPYQDPIVRLLQEHGVPVICQWTAGQLGPLLPTMVEHGFNCTWPLEVVAGMDAPALRRRFGRGLLLAGNIAKEAVIAGPGAIDAEIERLMPLIREGGFLPALDDMASPDMPFAHYRYMIEKLQAIRRGEVAMIQARDFRDGLCRPALSLRAGQLLSTVCIRGGLACPILAHDEAQAFLRVVGGDPTAAIRLVSDADEVPHHTVLWRDPSQAPQPGEPVPAEVLRRKRDLDVLQRLGLTPGDTRRARYLYELLFARIETPDGICAYDTPGWEGCPHAKSGVYERVRQQGWQAMVYARSREEMDASRQQSAKRIAEGDRLFVRPHHFMCMACWYAGGEGTGPRPNDTICEIFERVRREPTVPVTLIEGACEACYCCDGFDPATTRCVHAGGLIRDYKKDLDVFRKLGLAPGATMPAREFVRLLFEKIASTKEVCGYGDGIVRSEEWRICGDPAGNPGYAKSRETGMF